jgi:hypothetical protein
MLQKEELKRWIKDHNIIVPTTNKQRTKDGKGQRFQLFDATDLLTLI